MFLCANVVSYLFVGFLAFDFCWFCVVIRVFSSPPHRPMTSDFERFLYQILSITLFSYLYSLKKEPVFPFSMLSANQVNYWYHFITSLVWRGPWLGIELGTSRTLSQHSTTRLSRRRLLPVKLQKKIWCCYGLVDQE